MEKSVKEANESTSVLWKKTGCALCPQNCGLEVLVENNRIIKVKPDKENPAARVIAVVKA